MVWGELWIIQNIISHIIIKLHTNMTRLERRRREGRRKKCKRLTILTISKYIFFLFYFPFSLFKPFQIDHGALPPSLMVLLYLWQTQEDSKCAINRPRNNVCHFNYTLVWEDLETRFRIHWFQTFILQNAFVTDSHFIRFMFWLVQGDRGAREKMRSACD